MHCTLYDSALNSFSFLQSQKKLEVATLKDEISKLKSQIVESPEELKNEMEKMKESIKNIKISKVGEGARCESCMCKCAGL